MDGGRPASGKGRVGWDGSSGILRRECALSDDLNGGIAAAISGGRGGGVEVGRGGGGEGWRWGGMEVGSGGGGEGWRWEGMEVGRGGGGEGWRWGGVVEVGRDGGGGEGWRWGGVEVESGRGGVVGERKVRRREWGKKGEVERVHGGEEMEEERMG